MLKLAHRCSDVYQDNMSLGRTRACFVWERTSWIVLRVDRRKEIVTITCMVTRDFHAELRCICLSRCLLIFSLETTPWHPVLHFWFWFSPMPSICWSHQTFIGTASHRREKWRQMTLTQGGLPAITSWLCLADKKIQMAKKDNYIDEYGSTKRKNC